MTRRWMVSKRLLDLTLGGVLLVVLALPMLVIAVAARFVLGSPVLFRSERPGLNGEIFTMYKFRTMSADVDDDGRPLPDEARLARFGRALRSLSLDELPELLNVVRGNMSLVGPRPLLPRYLERYTGEQARRHEVKPGITGLAQVRGRNDTSWEERLALDVWYVDNRSMLLDLRILAATIGRVGSRRGISAPGHATMPEFRGPEES
jgi:sugar transferase EpsL